LRLKYGISERKNPSEAFHPHP
jgi:hypothetical protein